MEHNTSYRMSLAFMVSVAITAGVSAPVGSQERDNGIIRMARVLPDEPEFQCVANSEFSIAGLKLYQEMAALGALGTPNSLVRGFGEDDGGGYVLTTYRYGGLEVDVVRGRIDRIEARAPAWPTPAGLMAGMERAETLALLGHAPDPDHLHDGVYSFSGCPEWRGGELAWDHANNYFEFAFGADGCLAFIRLIADRP